MEGIVVIAIIYALFKMFSNKAKIVMEQGKTQSAVPATEQGAHHKQSAQATHRHHTEPPTQSWKTATEGATNAPYQTIKPMVTREHVMENYTGSLATTSQEGAASQEGLFSSEGGNPRSERIARTDSAEAYRIGEPQTSG